MIIWITGDSTTRNQAKGHPLTSWGEVIENSLNIEVVNAAMSSYSIRSFVNNGDWGAIMEKASQGDILLACHGHLERASLVKRSRGCRGSLPGDSDHQVVVYDPFYKRHETVRTFGWYVRKYISDCHLRGINLILLSPTPRAVWHEGKIHRGASLEYVHCMERISAEMGARFLDIGEVIANEFNTLGDQAVAKFFKDDVIHTNLIGAEFMARIILKALVERFPELFKGLTDLAH